MNFERFSSLNFYLFFSKFWIWPLYFQFLWCLVKKKNSKFSSDPGEVVRIIFPICVTTSFTHYDDFIPKYIVGNYSETNFRYGKPIKDTN